MSGLFRLTILGLMALIASICVPNESSAQTWGAISLSVDGTYSALWNRNSRYGAHDEALADCEKRSSKPEKCTTVAAQDSMWITALRCKTSSQSASSVVSRVEILDALEVAYSQAFDLGYKRENCTLLVAIKADGTHAPKEGVTRAWGAISLSTDGQMASVWRRLYKVVAEAEALSDCRAMSQSPQKCTTISAYGSSWVVGVRCRKQSEVRVIVASGDTEADALADIYNDAKDYGYDPARCSIVGKITANGSHRN